MVKNYLAVALTVALFSPLSASAHAGHEHGGGNPRPLSQQEPQAQSSPDATQIEIMQENIMLKKELERQKMAVEMKYAEKETEKAATRSSFIVTGMLFIGLGLVIRYLPRRAGK